MLTEMDKRTFDALDDDTLVTACARTVIAAYKESGTPGENFHAGLFERLTPGQQALFWFRVYYDHVIGSADDFRWWTCYFLPQSRIWANIRHSLRFFGDEALVLLLVDLERSLRKRAAGQGEENGENDLDPGELYSDPALQPLFSHAFERFRELAPGVSRRIAGFIRTKPVHYVRFVRG